MHFYDLAFFEFPCYNVNKFKESERKYGMSRRSKIFLGLAVFITFFIFGNSLQSAEVSDGESSRVFALVSALLSSVPTPWLSHHLIRKLAHFTEFFLQSGCLSLSAVYREGGASGRRIPVLFIGLLTACTDELIQVFVSGRSSQVTDVWIDFSGVCLAALIIFFIDYRKKGMRK